MSNLGECERANVAIFADTQDEPQWVYDALEDAKKWSKIPIEVVTAGRLSDRWEEEGLFIPAFTSGGGMLWRTCTDRFKIAPITKALRKRGENITLMIGISVDEAHRMKPNRNKWITNTWPLVDKRINRAMCEQYLQKHNIKVPGKSSCVYCPFHSDFFWKNLKQNHPTEFFRAVECDKKIRNHPKLKNEAYLHVSCKPLDELDFAENQMELFGNECEGYCGV